MPERLVAELTRLYEVVEPRVEDPEERLDLEHEIKTIAAFKEIRADQKLKILLFQVVQTTLSISDSATNQILILKVLTKTAQKEAPFHRQSNLPIDRDG